MSQYQGDDADEMEDDYQAGGAEDDMDEDYNGSGLGDSDSDDEEYGQSAAFLFTVVGITGFLGVIAGQLPGDWGFFVPYLLGSISLIVLAIGSISPGVRVAISIRLMHFLPIIINHRMQVMNLQLKETVE